MSRRIGIVGHSQFYADAALKNNIADFHNAIPRDKDITAYFTDGTLWKRIKGTDGFSLFEDLFVGDYLTVGGQTYIIVDFDYYIRCGSVDITDHHLVMMPATGMKIPSGTVLYKTNSEAQTQTLTLITTATAGQTVTSQETETNKKWNATLEAPNTNTTAGGYKFSRMRQIIMRAADTIVVNAFGSAHIKPITVWYPNPASASDSGLASNAAWFANDDWEEADRKSICDLPNETQIYGQQVWGMGSAYTSVGYEVGVDKWQFSLFRVNHSKANTRAAWWLRSVSSATFAASVYGYGSAHSTGSSHACGVRPRFLLF